MIKVVIIIIKQNDMKLLKIYERNKSSITDISNFNYGNLEENKINQITIYENPEQFKEKIVEVFDFNEKRIGGIIKDYSWNPKTKRGVLFIFPLLFDLQQDFIQDDLGNKIYYVSGKMEEILDDILTQYLDRVSTPVLSKGNFATTTKNVVFTFKYANLYEALQFLQDKMLEKGFYIKVDVDGKVNLVNISGIVNLFNEKEILEIDFKKRGSEKIKQIIFDNKKLAEDPDRILKTYNNPSVTIGAVKYVSDSRFKDEESVDDYIQNIFDDSGDKIEVQSVISEIDVPLYAQINIYNWEKNFGDIYVIGKQYLNDGKYNLKLGNDVKFKIDKDDIASVENSIDYTNENMGDLVPDYIQETYIDSVEVRSPTISGNNGLFSGLVKVGVSGITIDGPDKSIFSNNYNLTNKTGFKFKEDGTFLLGKDTNNYFQYDGTNFNFSGKIVAKAGSSIEWDYVENAPTGDWNNPDYIKSTYIDSTQILSPNISGNTGYFSGVFKVGVSGIVIDGINKYIKSSNYSAGSSGWIIDNDGNVEFQDGLFRGEIRATSGTFSGNISSSATITGGTFSGGIYEATSGYDKIKLFNYGGLPTIQFIDGGRIGANINLKEDLLISEFKILKEVSSFIDKVFIGIKNETYIEIRYSGLGDEEFKFIGGDINMDGNHIQNVNNLYCDDLYASRIRANYTQVYGDNFTFNYSPMAIPASTLSGAGSMPSSDVVKGQMHYETDVNKLWIYNGSAWKSVALV